MTLEQNNNNSNNNNISDSMEAPAKRKREVYHYQSEWLVSSIAWRNDSKVAFELALGSFIEEYSNHVTLVKLAKDDSDQEIQEVTTFEHPYPPTRILWKPNDESIPVSSSSSLLTTSADFLRIWRVESESQRQHDDGSKLVGSQTPAKVERKVKLESLLKTKETDRVCAPITSFDWNRYDSRMIVSSCVDTTCAIWDIETSQQQAVTSASLRSQILAHNHEVYDVSFLQNSRDVFVSVGGDGSARLFDLRKLETSTILYEVNDLAGGTSRALVRVSCNRCDPYYLSTFRLGSNEIVLLDLRNSANPVAILASHTSSVNCMSWAPHSAHHICSASEDSQALIWQLSDQPSQPLKEPLLAYKANGPINAIDWSASHSDWVAIGYNNRLEMLRV